MTQDYREDWLSDLGKRTGLTTLEFDQSGVCQLMLDTELVLTLYKPDTSAKLVIFGQLHTPPLPIEITKEMLKRNRSNAKLSAPVISLSPEEDAIEVHLVLDQAELEKGEDMIEKVIAELEYWKAASLNDFKEEVVRDQVSYNINFA
ncbi:MAG: Tir chaperone protein (CesT) family [Proteobacteria bacterium]|nr:Tir chaperone protein (CesT) family [Pseudomonadota bacterium]